MPEAFTEPVKDPLGDLLARFARTHGPFTAARAAERFGLGTAVTDGALQRLAASGRTVQGEFHPAGIGQEWCDATVLRRLRRRSLAALRQELEPAEPAATASFLPQPAALRLQPPAVHRPAGPRRRTAPGRARPRIRPGAAILPSRVMGYTPAMLDELTTTGELIWAGAGALPGKDGWLSLYPADSAPLLLPAPTRWSLSALHESLLTTLSGGYGLFFRQIADQVRATTHPDSTDQQLADALWELASVRRLTNDTLAPLRSLRAPDGRRAPPPSRPAASAPRAVLLAAAAARSRADRDETGLRRTTR
ncbi:ATP-dependent helicase (Fragment) OS=Streptomyces microflavus OX=1919 GN=G3I39_01275 PE=4 SV=1 [Streptomyces microflavus]